MSSAYDHESISHCSYAKYVEHVSRNDAQVQSRRLRLARDETTVRFTCSLHCLNFGSYEKLSCFLDRLHSRSKITVQIACALGCGKSPVNSVPSFFRKFVTQGWVHMTTNPTTFP